MNVVNQAGRYCFYNLEKGMLWFDNLCEATGSIIANNTTLTDLIDNECGVIATIDPLYETDRIRAIIFEGIKRYLI